ncbi:MAG: phospholipase C, phosphocholine-specific [Bacteroidetes bacterium]|nr:phospholipase C, phosphocholine-specific [Bacteroidota bacterium]
MDTRREFLKKAAMYSVVAGVSQFLPGSIQRAFAIDPDTGTTYLDAEHIVFLMQENRSFDHTFGTLRGVRGYNDPRAIRLPDKNLVWLQTNEKGETYAPFRLDIKNTKATWMGSLPHSWSNQVDARNGGKYDHWLQAKKPGGAYKDMPLTMGYYTRADLPFYYALADAFTVCDHNFCSSLTGTTPNRLHFWTGTIRAQQNEKSRANVWNEQVDYPEMAGWKTFPERLEENGISWKIYQNDISVDGLVTGEQDYWLDNFTDNPIEFFKQYNVKLSRRYIDWLAAKDASLPGEIAELERKLTVKDIPARQYDALQKQLKDLQALHKRVMKEKPLYTREKYNALSAFQKSIHERAFTTNVKDPHYHDLQPLRYKDGNTEREITVPKGDVLYQFREDVENGQLPSVSWIVAPEAFSDHPSSAWFGAWYVSEVMDILTKDPEVWKKTIFVLTYDENDGYYDHLPPFVAPDPHNADTGRTSPGIDTAVDYVSMAQEKAHRAQAPETMRESPIGLGFRVPMVIASPWSRGGYVNSQVFDHTSSLQFMEKWLSHKTGKKIEETNISKWRRTICGDLTSVFRPYKGEKMSLPEALNKELFIESIHKAKFKAPPSDFKKLSAAEIEAVNKEGGSAMLQEKGIKPANALPYEIYADGRLSADKKSFEIMLHAGNKFFGARSAGVPFNVYIRKGDDVAVRSYAVLPGDKISDTWATADDPQIEIYGPNGFYRLYRGNAGGMIETECVYDGASIRLTVQNNSGNAQQMEIYDHYSRATQSKMVDAQSSATIRIETAKFYGWYDVSLTVKANGQFSQRYAGKVESGQDSMTDPIMGGVL